MPLHPLINFEIQRYHQKESKFKDVYLNCLPEIKDGEYVINLGEHELIACHFTGLYVKGADIT